MSVNATDMTYPKSAPAHINFVYYKNSISAITVT